MLLAACAMGAALILASCANQSATNASSTNPNPALTTYTSSDLNNTGRHDTASAIEAIDPSVRISGGR